MKSQNLILTLVILAGFPLGSDLATASQSESSPAVVTSTPPEGSSNIGSGGNIDSQRIRFAPGDTSATVGGELPAYAAARYKLWAFAGQLMQVSLSSPNGASLSVTTAAGVPLSSSSTSFRGYLPVTGDYILAVSSGGKPVSYSVYISIPQRISFEWGTTSATLQGYVYAGQSHHYILRAMAGQLMEIKVTPEDPEDSLQLIVYGVDGTVLKSGMSEGLSFRGELPFSQDYLVTVRAGGQDVTYTIDVIIPQRINFQSGAVSGDLRGYLRAGHSQYYVLRAMGGQIMQVEVAPGENVQLIVYGADGTVLKSGMGEGASFRGRLPVTGDYVLVVRAGAGSNVVYSLRVKIITLLEFLPGDSH
jgi:hypothetical protein